MIAPLIEDAVILAVIAGVRNEFRDKWRSIGIVVSIDD